MNKKDNGDIGCLVPISNLMVDLINDKRISGSIRLEYANKLTEVAPWIVLLSLDYAQEKYPTCKLAKELEKR